MSEFKYVIKDKAQKTVTGSIEAPTQDVAASLLRDKAAIIISIAPLKKSSFSFDLMPSLSSIKISIDELSVFSRQLATMVNAGLPLVQGLEILSEQSEKKSFKLLIGKVKEAVEGGSSLSESLGKYPKAFSSLFINMISAGEASGMLDDILMRMASYLEDTSKLQKKVKAALIYPAVITLTAVAITVFMLVKVVPSFAEIYSGFGADLPGPTQLLLSVSRLVTDYLLLFLGGVAGLGFTFFMISRTDKGRSIIDTAILHVPIAGKLIKKVAISRFSRTLSTLIKSGVSILTSLDIVAKTCGNKVVEKVIRNVLESVKGGETIAQPLSKSTIFPPLVVKMVAVGEQTGSLEEMLVKVANFYDAEVSTTVEGLTSLIEPMVIVVLGVVIGGIVLALYLPVFNIANLIS
jgi:type IV pilus assembly protein PilC